MYTQCAGERVSSAMCLFVFEWASVVSPFCELVASGMSSQRFNGIYRLFAHNVHNRLCEMAVGGRHTRERGNSIIVHRACASQKIPNASMSSSWLSTISTLSYLALTLITTAFVCLSCAFLIVQAIRSSSSRSIKDNWDVVIIGAAYVLVVRRHCFTQWCNYDLTWRHYGG